MIRETIAGLSQRDQDRPVTAVLGPTNTGKTFYAMDRMAAHKSGMMGFPLRLLARENYDKLVERKGKSVVALVTGEEKIVPRNARYWICTVESMPLDLPVEFLAIDEIQLCADPDRGYIFTDRLLHARGLSETLFLGSESVRPIIEHLFPNAMFMTRPRLSTLTYVAPKKLSRVPPRSAVVAFSASEVYRIAELIRQQRGGTAVVLGALSPRTRNAQVEMYQAGEVDYLVATDAIGMGLNMDIDHVTFGGLRKFDGRHARGLFHQEIGQIAGRAGRHMNDGTFATSWDIGGLDEEAVEAVENHRYNPLELIYWRNRELNFSSVTALLKTLERPSDHPSLIKARDAEDHVSLRMLAKNDAIREMARSPAATRLLWDVCQIPDFRKTYTDAHGNLLAKVYRDIIEHGEINAEWAERQIARLDKTDGDIDTLVNRIANVRTWTYISHHAGWLSNTRYWQERSRSLEDRLSDALHDRLTNQFVDRRSALVLRRIKEGTAIEGAIQDDGKVVIEGEFVGELKGFDFNPDPSLTGSDGKPVLAASRKVVKEEIDRRLKQLLEDNDGAFCFGEDGGVQWRGTTIATLRAGDAPLSPKIRFKQPEMLSPDEAQAVEAKLSRWIVAHLNNAFGYHDALYQGEAVDKLSSTARGIAYQLWEQLGVVERGGVREMIKQLTPEDRKDLRALRVRFGRRYLWTTTLRSDRAKRALTTLKTAFPDNEELARANGMVSISAGRDRTIEGSIDAIEKALGRIWLMADKPKESPEKNPEQNPEKNPEKVAPTEGEAVALEATPEPVAEAAAEVKAEVEAEVEGDAQAAEAPAEAVAAGEPAAETPAGEVPAVETPVAEGSGTEASEEPAAEAATPSESTDKKPAAAKPTLSQEELDAKRDEDLLAMCDGDAQLVKAIWHLPEARGRRPANPNQGQNRNRGNAEGSGKGRGRQNAKSGGKPGGKPGDNPRDKPRRDGKPGGKPGGKSGGNPGGGRKPQREKQPDPNSPFAALAGLTFGKK